MQTVGCAHIKHQETVDVPDQGFVIQVRGEQVGVTGLHAAIAAQATLRKIAGQNNTWFAGAYTRHGFHEDGYASAVDVVRRLGEVPAWA